MNLYGLIGYPLGHSFSPSYFKKKFEALNLTNFEYRAFEIKDLHKLPVFLDGQPHLKGFNVTIPYKKEIIGFMHELHYSVLLAGGVNVVRIKQDRLIGYNSDLYGVEKCLLPKLKPSMNKALILGSGGSSKTVAYVLRSVGIKCSFVSRSKHNPYFLTYQELNEDMVADYDVIVNTTPVGMFPNTEQVPAIPLEGFREGQLCFDLIYNPEKTMLLEAAEMRGAETLNGMPMLIAQAEKSWEIWNGQI
jgi:shikimate dehydrogenase